MNRQRLEQLAREWRWHLVLRDLLLAQAAGLAALTGMLWHPAFLSWGIFAVCFGGVFAGRLLASRPWRLDATRVCRHLNRTNPAWEESAALYLCPDGDLTLLERWQRQRIDRTLLAKLSESDRRRLGQPPDAFLLPASACTLTAAGLALLTLWHLYRQPQDRVATLRRHVTAQASPLPSVSATPKIVGSRLVLTPPAYTGRPARTVDGPNAEVEEGGTVAWDIAVAGEVRQIELVTGSSRTPLAATGGGHWLGDTTGRETALFSLAGTLPDGAAWNPPELFSIRVIPDRAPIIRVAQPEPARTEIAPPAPGKVMVEVVVGDDYGVTEAHLIATVAKGSGEVIKFREQTITFDAAGAGEAGTASEKFTKGLDLVALGLEPGDELYFFVEAHDNRQPEPNRTHSETHFIHLKGPEEKAADAGRGVTGINQIPPYFRSERQLIIDTEKLIADQPTLADADFRARANDLGQDQALLRLRYGRFLGEDQEDSALTDHAETSTNPFEVKPPAQATGPRAAASMAARFRQEHAEQDSGGGVENGPPGTPDAGKPPTAEQIRQPFVDTHDLHDKNTFFDGGTQGTMRDALGAMWETEKFLRTARPQEALVPEHRALEILKDLQQSARSYVQHIGFEAPPLKVAERRLKGEVTDVPERAALPGDTRKADPTGADVRAALRAGETGATLPPSAAARVEAALTRAATRDPGIFLAGLQAWRRRAAGEAMLPEQSRALQRALLQLLPPAHPLPARPEEDNPALVGRYFQTLAGGETRP